MALLLLASGAAIGALAAAIARSEGIASIDARLDATVASVALADDLDVILETHAHRRADHLDQRAINARVTLRHDDTKAPERQFSCSMRVSVPGPDLFAEDHESDLYAAIDLVTKKIEQQIRKRHNKHKARKHTEAAQVKIRRQEANL